MEEKMQKTTKGLSPAYHLGFWILAPAIAGVLFAGCVASVKDADQFSGTIPPGMGILVVTVDSTVEIPVLRLKRATDAFAAVAGRGIPAGRSLHFVLLPAGRYTWAQAQIPCNHMVTKFSAPCYYLDFEMNDATRYTFDVKADTVNYPGDLEVIYSWGYQSELIDRTAMVLRDLNAAHGDIVRRFGFAYTGPGDDAFYDYYQSLKPVTGAKP